MIDVDYNEYKETLAQNMKLIIENHDLKEEVERLNNIINKFEKYLEETKGIYEEYTCAIKKLKELKGVDKNEKTS